MAAATLALVGVAVGGYVAARQTALLALNRVEVQGAPPGVASEVRKTLSAYVGQSLVRFDAAEAARKLSTLADVASARFDRAFPHTLKVRVRLERPVAVLRQGPDGWLVSASARVLQKLDRPYPSLPRIWVPRSVDVSVNSTLGGLGAQGVAALAPLRPLKVAAEVREVRPGDGALTLVLGSGTELRLGNAGDLRLKLAIAKTLLPLAVGARYVDVSVPERPVAGYNPQVEG
ncbi:MAG TPA: FtsQ-type POTRA domain-containing protein [Gaiellaceae bacterium]|nr:FtsQ-type POTRA domain-containing protein [Gaiellaceae bacterium]